VAATYYDNVAKTMMPTDQAKTYTVDVSHMVFTALRHDAFESNLEGVAKYVWFALGISSTQRRAIAQSSIVAKATRQENSSKSFRVLMDIGAPAYAASPIAHPKMLAKK
jgi:hypothetical protein